MGRQKFNWSAPRKDRTGSAAFRAYVERDPPPLQPAECPDWLVGVVTAAEWRVIDDHFRYRVSAKTLANPPSRTGTTPFQQMGFDLQWQTNLLVSAATAVSPALGERVRERRDRWMEELIAEQFAIHQRAWSPMVNPFKPHLKFTEWEVIWDCLRDRLNVELEQWFEYEPSHRAELLTKAVDLLLAEYPRIHEIKLKERLLAAVADAMAGVSRQVGTPPLRDSAGGDVRAINGHESQ